MLDFVCWKTAWLSWTRWVLWCIFDDRQANNGFHAVKQHDSDQNIGFSKVNWCVLFLQSSILTKHPVGDQTIVGVCPFDSNNWSALRLYLGLGLYMYSKTRKSMWKLKVACSQLALYELSKNLWAQVRAMSSDCDSEFVLSNTLHSTSNINLNCIRWNSCLMCWIRAYSLECAIWCPT